MTRTQSTRAPRPSGISAPRAPLALACAALLLSSCGAPDPDARPQLASTRQAAEKAPFYDKYLTPEMKDLIKLGGDLVGAYTGAGTAIKTVMGIGTMLGLFPEQESAFEREVENQLGRISENLQALNGTVLGQSYIDNLRATQDLAIGTLSASQTVREWIAYNQSQMPEELAAAALFESLNNTNKLSQDETYFLRPAHVVNGEDDQNNGASGEWKQVVALRPTVSNNTVWDASMGLPALVQSIAGRVNVLAGVYPDFKQTGRFADELLGYRSRLIEIRNRIESNIACGVKIDERVIAYAYDTGVVTPQFHAKAICADISTGLQTEREAVGSLPEFSSYCAAHRPVPIDNEAAFGDPYDPYYEYSCGELTWSPVQPSSFLGAQYDYMRSSLDSAPDFEDFSAWGEDDAKQQLRIKLGLFEIQKLIDRLYALATNDQGPFSNSWGSQQISSLSQYNTCVGINPATGELGLMACLAFDGQNLLRANSWQYDAVSSEVIADDGSCLDVQWGSTRVTSKVWTWSCNGGDAQRWSYDPERHRWRNALGGVLSTNAYHTLWTWLDQESPSQLWGREDS